MTKYCGCLLSGKESELFVIAAFCWECGALVGTTEKCAEVPR